MKLNIIVDGRTNVFEVPDDLLIEAEMFFDKLDADMNNGWQMSRDWVEMPNPEQRCQIAADKILTAIDTDNEKLLMLMAAYILRTMPSVKTINIDNTGDMNETELILEHESVRPLGPIFN
ncbi:hypothetical protein MNBD_GAMMA05-1504 [hydrothermal vent metagenome]|uniref:Uncharacterized protein n=1 Tax=hydrothermal vent metagenome TaxID=652676 RepID=A0A3B0WGR2_9ZZZZ